jgi:hypothetical protein
MIFGRVAAMAKQQRPKEDRRSVDDADGRIRRVLKARRARRVSKKVRVQHVLKALQSSEMKEQPLGSYVVINIDTGEYVSAQTMMDANTFFLERFPGAMGFAHRLGEPLFSPLRLES